VLTGGARLAALGKGGMTLTNGARLEQIGGGDNAGTQHTTRAVGGPREGARACGGGRARASRPKLSWAEQGREKNLFFLFFLFVYKFF
jgi:hypothetical protein